MSLVLTKAPWPEWEEIPRAQMDSVKILPVNRAEYAFARHRVNLFEELVTELERCAQFHNMPNCNCLACRNLRRLLEEARK